MRVRIAGQKTGQDAARDGPCANLASAWCLSDKGCHVVVARALAEKLVKLLEMTFRAAVPSIEALNERRSTFDALDCPDLGVNEFVVRQQRAICGGGEKLIFDDIAQRTGRKLGDDGRYLVAPCRTKALAVLDREKLGLNTGEGRTAGKGCRRRGIAEINRRFGDRRGIYDRNSAGAVMPEGEQQREAVGRVNLQRSSLSIAQPALGDEI